MRASAAVQLRVVFERGLALLLNVGVLAATGIASGTPCCTLQQLSRPVSAEMRDCCDSPDCCRVEKRGVAQAALSIKAPEVGALAVLPVSHPLFAGVAAVASGGAPWRLSFSRTDHPPPRGGRDLHLRISLLRI
jgi:hypothetical protein